MWGLGASQRGVGRSGRAWAGAGRGPLGGVITRGRPESKGGGMAPQCSCRDGEWPCHAGPATLRRVGHGPWTPGHPATTLLHQEAQGPTGWFVVGSNPHCCWHTQHCHCAREGKRSTYGCSWRRFAVAARGREGRKWDEWVCIYVDQTHARGLLRRRHWGLQGGTHPILQCGPHVARAGRRMEHRQARGSHRASRKKLLLVLLEAGSNSMGTRPTH